jgi:hypothetical protein
VTEEDMTADLDSAGTLGTPITIHGTAQNAKAGAVLIVDDGRVVYVQGLPEWEREVLGTELELTGTLRKERIYPDVDMEGGTPSQGMREAPLVLELSEPYRRSV